MALISEKDRARISRAIARAEKNTGGEIVAVIAERSSSYLFIPMLWAALAALAVPLPLLYMSQWPAQHVYALQLTVFALGGLLALWPAARYALVPPAIKRARAHRHAVAQFLAQNLHTTKGRTGVLIFVSVAERFAEVIADAGIYDKVAPQTWEGVVDALTGAIRQGRAADGFIAAINDCGAVLAQHFPPGSVNRDELPNHLIVLE